MTENEGFRRPIRDTDLENRRSTSQGRQAVRAVVVAGNRLASLVPDSLEGSEAQALWDLALDQLRRVL